MSGDTPDVRQNLNKLRACIERIDDELLRLINERAQIAHHIGKLKQGSVIYRPEREAQILHRFAETNRGPLTDSSVQHILREIMSACLALEQPLRVAYLGPAGTYSETAARKHFGSAPTFMPMPLIDDIFRAVEAGNVDYGVAPVENSTEGAIGRSLDLLFSTTASICGEVNLPIHHNLMTLAPSINDITILYSHTQSLGQCHEWLNRNLPTVPRVSVSSNAEAARLAAQEPNAAAVAGESAALLYQLPIISSNIEDDPHNTTRFVVLADHDAGRSGRDKTSLVCSALNRPGAVHDLLAPLMEHNVSMSRLESRPARGMGGGRWEYMFYVDIEGHRTDARIAAALAGLNERASFVKILGSYPTAVF